MAYSKTTWTDGTTPVDASSMNNIENELSDLDSRSYDYSYTSISQPTEDELPSGITLGTTWQCRLVKSGNVVNLRLNANGTITSGGSFKVLFTIPSGYRPSTYVVVHSYSSQDGDPMCLQIDTSGAVSFYSSIGRSSIGFIFRQNLTWVING